MTAREFGQLTATIKTFFPKDYVIPTGKAMELWYEMLKDLSYEAAEAGLKKYVSNNKFAPTIADIRECADSFNNPQHINEMEAWALVSKAIRNSGYHAVEEFAKLPPLVQKSVGLPDQLRTWALDENYSEEVASSHFIKCYRSVAQQEEEKQKLPSSIRQDVENANKGSYSAQIEDKRQKAINNTCYGKQEKIEATEERNKVVQIPVGYMERLESMLGS